MNAPWDDCKIAFAVPNGRTALDRADSMASRGELPRGWIPSEYDDAGARSVVVFRVAGIPSGEDGESVRRALDGEFP